MEARRIINHQRPPGRRVATLLLAVASLSLGASAAAGAEHTISDFWNGTVVTVRCTENDVTLIGIYAMDGYTQLKTNYLKDGPTSLLSFAVNGSPGSLTDVHCESQNAIDGLDISANSTDGLLSFAMQIWPEYTGYLPRAVTVQVQVTYQGSAPTAFFSATLPNLKVSVPGGNPMAMVPHQTLGGVLPLANVADLGLGATGTEIATMGLPTNLNALEVAELYDGNGKNGGVFFADLDGNYGNNVAPLQFRLTMADKDTAAITGYWTALLKPKQPMTMSGLAIGTHAAGDWHYAVDYYLARHSWIFPLTPKWFREAGGIYLLGVAGGGSFLNTFPDTPIKDPHFGIHRFACPELPTPPPLQPQRCLLDVYHDAQTLGADVIYLTTWWDHSAAAPQDYYGNKGDYVVRQDLGGAAGLRKGVDQIHSQTPRGRVILYLEPYQFGDNSTLMLQGPGPGWVTQPSPPLLTSACDHCLSITNTAAQDYLIERAANLMQETDVDGFFLDSWGWRMNWPAGTTAEDVYYSEQQWSAAALRFVDRLRTRLRSIKGDAIVMGENNSSEFPFHWDGGSVADLSQWNFSPYFQQDGGLVWASPARYAMPFATSFANGSGLSSRQTTKTDACGKRGHFNGSAIASINQVIAAGHNLALGPFFLLDAMEVGTVTDDPATHGYPPDLAKCPAGSNPPPLPPPPLSSDVPKYIKTLIQIRNRSHRDALVYGNQTMPATNYIATSSSDVVTYLYQGETQQVLAIVNNTDTQKNVVVTLDKKLGWDCWSPVLGLSSSKPIPEVFKGSSQDCPAKKAPAAADRTGTVSVTVSAAPTKKGGTMGGLAILARACDSACAFRQTGGPTPALPLMNESFSTAFGGSGMANWTDWMVKAPTAAPGGVRPLGPTTGPTPAPSGLWSLGTTTTRTRISTTEMGFLQVNSANTSALLFYDLFGGSDFTYIGGITFKSFGSDVGGKPNPIGGAGLSFRLSDNEQSLDAGQQGYDVVLTNDPIFPGFPDQSGSVQLIRRQSPSSPGGPTAILCSKQNIGVVAGKTYQLSVTAKTKWPQSPFFPPADAKNPDPNKNAYPRYPTATTFTVSVDGNELLTSCKDDAPYLSGRFGVNGFNVQAQFSCLQANGPEDSDGPMPPGCAPTIVQSLPPPGQKTQTGNGNRLPQ